VPTPVPLALDPAEDVPMTEHVICPACGSALEAPTSLIGQTIRCGRCEQIFVAQPSTGALVPTAMPVLQPGHYGHYPRPNTADATKGTVSLVLGLLGLVGWCLPIIGLPMTITGLVFGVKGQNSSNRTTATIGIVLNAIGLMLTVFNGALGAYFAVTKQFPTLHK
jgi:hypothetical protein